MYISPFWCGVFSVVLVEVMLLVLLAMRQKLRRKRER